uniref:GAG-pre-integrase domain-containing protein n=1 Tax=Tanacetum cinerariifolium TaxID=118510 RepID=A0A699GGZ5_TANCI|nr:hypothetical protein [Tanacetum cinerariifolium]
MTGNISYLSDFKEINRGYVAFGRNLKGSKITGRCVTRKHCSFTDTECVVLSPDFKLPDENHVLLRVPREHNMYNVDLKNVFLLGDLTCLFAKATLDEYNHWHRRLGYINFKTINKLVKGNLVRGLPSKVFEKNHTCVACKKGKQHRASTYIDLFSIKVNYGDSFTPKGGREYILDTYYNGPRDGVLTDDNMPTSPMDIEGPSEIPWLERKDCREDIGCGSSKCKETKVEASDNVTEYYDPFEDLDDILGQYSNEEHFKMNNDSDGFVDEQSMIEDVPKDIHPFKNDLEMNDTLVRIGDIEQSLVDVSEAYLDVIDLDSFSSDLDDGIDIERRKILRELRKQGKSIDRGMFDFFASNDGPIIKERQDNGNPSGNLLTCGKIARHNQKGDKAKGKMGPYPGQLLTAVDVDANNVIYLVTYVVVEIETKSSWCWFLKLLRLDLDSAKNSNFTFIFDSQKVNYKQSLATLRSKVKGLEFERERLKTSKTKLIQEVDGLRQDRAAVVQLFSMVCAALEEVATLKEPFKLKKMPGYRSFSKKEFDRADNDLANASYPFLAEVTTCPYAPLEVLLSKKLKSLRVKPISSNHGDICDLRYRSSSMILYCGALTRSFLVLYGSLGSIPNSRTSTKTSLDSREKVIEVLLDHWLSCFEQSFGRPANNASYSASLLVFQIRISFPSGLTNIKPAPDPSELEALSVYSFHMFSDSASSSFDAGFLAPTSLLSSEDVTTKKSASTFPLTELRPLNLMLFLPNSMAHLDFKRNRFNAAKFLLRLCISLTVFSGFRSEIAFTLKRLALIPCLVMRCLRNSPSLMPKEHFLGLRFMLITQSLSKPRTPYFRGVSLSFFFRSSTLLGLYVENAVPISLEVWNFMALWIVDNTISIFCIAVLLSSRLCRELDLTMTKFKVTVLVKGLSPIVIFRGTSPRGQDFSPEGDYLLRCSKADDLRMRRSTLAVEADRSHLSLGGLQEVGEGLLYGFHCIFTLFLKASTFGFSFNPASIPVQSRDSRTSKVASTKAELITGLRLAEVESWLASSVFSGVLAVKVETVISGSLPTLGLGIGVSVEKPWWG